MSLLDFSAFAEMFKLVKLLHVDLKRLKTVKWNLRIRKTDLV